MTPSPRIALLALAFALSACERTFTYTTVQAPVPNGVFEMPPGVTITNVRVSDDGYATRISGLLTAETDGTFHVQCGAYKDGQQVAAPSGWASDTASGIPAKFDTIDLSSHGTPDHFRCKVTDQ